MLTARSTRSGVWRACRSCRERFKVRVNHKTREQFDVVKGLMRSPSVTEVVNACDAGREGELIFAYLYGLSGCRKPCCGSGSPPLTHEAIRRVSTLCARALR